MKRNLYNTIINRLLNYTRNFNIIYSQLPTLNTIFGHLITSLANQTGNIIKFLQAKARSYNPVPDNLYMKKTQLGNGWTQISISLPNLLLHILFFKVLLEQITLGAITTTIIFKAQYESGEFRNLGPIQHVNQTHTLEYLLDVYQEIINNLNKVYREINIIGLSLMYKDMVDIPPTVKVSTSSIKDQIDETDNKFDKVPFISTTTDFENVGVDPFTHPIIKVGTKIYNHIKKDIDQGNIVRLFNGYLLVYIPTNSNIKHVLVYRLPKNITSFVRLSLIHHLTFIPHDPTDPTSFEVLFDVYTLTFKNGKFISGTHPCFVNFMKPTVDANSDKNDWDQSRIITMDIETQTINGVITPYAVGIYDGVNFTSFYLTDYKDIDDMIISSIKFLMKCEYHKRMVYIHNFSYYLPPPRGGEAGGGRW